MQSFSQSRSSFLNDYNVRSIKFYPSPATSNINFEFQKAYDQSYTFLIFNFIGKKVFTTKTITPKINIDLADFYRGIYIFQLIDKSGNIAESGKFQVINNIFPQFFSVILSNKIDWQNV